MSDHHRLISLDALRGLTIIGMIIVNNPGDWYAAYPPLCHAEWIGCTPTDLVFPFFLFIMGFSLFLSVSRRLQKGSSKKDLLIHLAKRSAIIFLIGLILNAIPFKDLGNLRILGVLQRIALVNFFCGLMLLYIPRKSRAFIAYSILFAYWILLEFIPSPLSVVPTIAYEYNWVAWLDQLVLGRHTWGQMPLMDPEGILSTFPAIVTGLIGMEMAHLFNQTGDKKERVIQLFFFGLLLTAAGLSWGTIFPLVKKLWTSSYVLYTAGLASMTLGAMYWIIDLRKKEKWTRLLIAFGSNPLALYVGSDLIIMLLWLLPIFGTNHLILNTWIFKGLTDMNISPNIASLTWAILYTSFWAVIATILYKRKIIIKV